MKDRKSRIHGGVLLLALGITAALAGAALSANPNERDVKPEPNVQDPDRINIPDGKLWVLDFRFKDPRLIKVNVPGRGQQMCMYLWYQVINNTGKPRFFIPDFELKTNDLNMVYQDDILPTVEQAIREIEDPNGYLRMKNSVTVANEAIPPSRPEAAPLAVSGVAIWMDPNELYPADDAQTREEKGKMPKLADSNNFSIFIAGLSNGWTETDPIPPDTRKVVRRKTLQLNFRRLGDRFFRKSEEIRFDPPAKWVYRASKLSIPMLAPADKMDE